MLFRRLHLFELNDRPWLPRWWRDYSTDYLEALFTRFGIYEPAAPVLAGLLQRCSEHRILDLCSGAGGPYLALIEGLSESAGREVEVLLSDQFPNRAAFERLRRESAGRIRFVDEPVDAQRVPPHLPGVRTLFDALHHFPPEAARAILADAVANRRPIAVFEAVSRTPRAVLGAALVPLLVLLVTPWVRPFRWRRLLFTYLLPVLPISIGWDGFVSHLRAYRLAELETMVSDASCAGHEWRIGWLPAGPLGIQYVVGWPRTPGGASLGRHGAGRVEAGRTGEA